MAHGGARAGAGRKLGSATAKTREIADRALADGISPLEFMLQVMRDGTAERAERLDMAKAAAPYIHPRLSSIEAKVDADIQAAVRTIERRVIDPLNTNT
jgi:hypothetical protein